MKVPTPRQLSSGRWFIQLRLGGESIPVTEETRAACIATAQLIKAEHVAGRPGRHRARASDRTVGQIIDDYIETMTPVLSPSTVRGYLTIRRNRFQQVMELRPDAVKTWQKVINAELAEVSEKSVQNAWGLITAALRAAKVPVPEVKLAEIPENELSFLEPEEIPAFLDAIRGDPCEVEMLLELHGLRASEALEVVRENRIDLRRNVITVKGAFVRGEDGFVEKRTNKSRAGTRPVQILIPRLSELVKEYQTARQPIPTHSASMILEHVHKACSAAGVTDVTNHGLRRTFASLGYSCGISERVLMEMGGWSDPGTMHKIYIKLSKRDRRAAVDALAAFYRPKTTETRLQAAIDALAQLQKDYADIPELEAVFAEVAKLNAKLNDTKAANR